MKLSKSTEKLLIEMVKNEDNLAGFLKDKFESLSGREDMKIRGRLKELKENGLFQSTWADNIPYNPSLTHLAEDYLEENELFVKEFDKDKLIEILRAIGQQNGITNVLIYDIQSCGLSQIGWKQTDEQEWKIKIEASDTVKVKKVSREIETELLKYDFVKVDMDDDDSTPRFKRYIDFAHKSFVKENNTQEIIHTMDFDMFNLKASKTNKLIDITNHFFDVSFTFAGESRDVVEQVVKELEKIIDKNLIFYDNYYISQLARPSLDILLQDIYRNRSKLIVIFLCEKYQEKKWCGLEFRAIREMIMEKEITKIMYIRLDAGHVDGVFQTDGYIDGTKFTPQELAGFINERLKLIV